VILAFLSEAPLECETLVRQVRGSRHGAVVSFVGTVRDHHQGKEVVALSYSAYGPMAERLCREIVKETQQRWPVSVALSHRIGDLSIGDPAVIVVVAGDHRDEAFAGCRHVIEEVKRRVPIWKRERYADATEAWVDPTVSDGTRPAAPEVPQA
jgi:molybdopterin synthase catalytic subunit